MLAGMSEYYGSEGFDRPPSDVYSGFGSFVFDEGPSAMTGLGREHLTMIKARGAPCVAVCVCVCVFVCAWVRRPWVPRWHPSGAFIDKRICGYPIDR